LASPPPGQPGWRDVIGVAVAVRHAHAGDKHAWVGPDTLRSLSEPGRREAHGLLTQLRDYPITRILSSPAVRCLQTIEPLAQRRGLPIEPAQVLGVDGGLPRLSLCCWTGGG
jgi:8-oxo-dGTP diphosphatase